MKISIFLKNYDQRVAKVKNSWKKVLNSFENYKNAPTFPPSHAMHLPYEPLNVL